MSGFEVVGVIFALPGVIEACIRSGELLMERIRKYQDSVVLFQLYQFIADLVRGEIHTLLRFFASIETRLQSWVKADIRRMVFILNAALQVVEELLPKSGTTMNRLKFSLRDSGRVKRACAELDEWQARFLRRAISFLFFGDEMLQLATSAPAEVAEVKVVSRIRNIRNAVLSINQPRASQEQPPILLREPLGATKAIENSSLWVSEDGSTLVEYRAYPYGSDSDTIDGVRATVRDIARALHAADPSVMGILCCKGFAAEPLADRFQLHYALPASKLGTVQRSLRDLFLDPTNKTHGLATSINDRLNVAKGLASAVVYIHSSGFVHKNIRSDNVIVIPSSDEKYQTYPYAIGEPYLVGYDGVRKLDAESQRAAVNDSRKRIYLSPARQKMHVSEKFTTKHDMYSLGVVLLEIAMWGSFTDTGGIGKRIRQKNGELLPPEEMRDAMVTLATKQIPRIFGNRYAEAVISCLTEMKDEVVDARDSDGVYVHQAYITAVMQKLEEITI